MKLVEALKIVQQPAPPAAPPMRVLLACGFTPLHLQTFLGAFLKRHGPDRAIAVQTGLFGDCLGAIERACALPLEAIAAVLEWADFDPRLGLRSLGGWRPGDLSDIVATATQRCAHLADAIESTAARLPVAVCMPTLPLPPADIVPGWRAGSFALDLRAAVAAQAARLSRHPRVRLVDPQRLDERSPLAQRFDIRAELAAGFPFTTAHAAVVAELLALLLQPPQPRKGLITDLDDTLWAGVIGDLGVDGISWDLDHHTHVHALFQQMLAGLADAGVLLAAASKNNRQVVEAALRRPDLVLPADRLFPLEVHWQAKSASVARILQTWNVGPESVVFVDDSPMELAEVQAAFPALECVQFKPRDEADVYRLLQHLRDRFGKDMLAPEDALRRDSLRTGAAFRTASGDGAAPDSFLADAAAVLTLQFVRANPEPRALELVNKTNQFNLNGRCFTEGAWLSYVQEAGTILLEGSYKDKFGPLGKIAVLAGRLRGSAFVVESWVMSCRAFARRIEHRCLEVLFARLDVATVEFAFAPTPRNAPIQDMLTALLGRPPVPGARLAHAEFRARCPALYHNVEVVTDV